MPSFGRKKYTVSEAAQQQRSAESMRRDEQRRQAAEKAEMEADEQDEMVRRGSAVTVRSETLAAQMATGTARLADVQEVLAEDFSGEPYADLRVLTCQCMLMGLDAGSGALGLGPRAYLAGIRSGLTHDAAITGAMVTPRSFDLWMQDPDFAQELAEARP